MLADSVYCLLAGNALISILHILDRVGSFAFVTSASAAAAAVVVVVAIFVDWTAVAGAGIAAELVSDSPHSLLVGAELYSYSFELLVVVVVGCNCYFDDFEELEVVE